MRIVVYGAGAIGGLIGGRLWLAGHDVVLIARGVHLETIQRQGLRIESPTGPSTVECKAVAGASELDWSGDELLLVATKSQDSQKVVDDLQRHAPESVPIVCAQNGVENERRFARHFGRVYGMCVMCPATHLQPGKIVSHSAPIAGLLDIGRYPHGQDEVTSWCSNALSGSTFESVPRHDIMRWKYRKLLLNLGNAVEALFEPSEAAGELARLARDEGLQCLNAVGIPVVSASEDAERRAGKLQLQAVEGQGRAGGSTWQSLARSNGSVETDYLNGEIVLLGRLHGVPTPTNSFLQHAMKDAVRRKAPVESLDAKFALRMVST